ncbi:uncharacterized protein LOC142602974 [Balearica regulorum gibbericeps]|uniref:uncharacterized protein LOC142602974 n=1 Tax=Balearica regulorum gibbericeps TaxID=100784 RepID=UPI003F62A3CD
MSHFLRPWKRHPERWVVRTRSSCLSLFLLTFAISVYHQPASLSAFLHPRPLFSVLLLFRRVRPVPCPVFILPSFCLSFFFVLLSCSPTLFLAPSDCPFPGTFVSLLLAPVFLSPLPSPRLPLWSLSLPLSSSCLYRSVLLAAPLFLTLPQCPTPRSSFPLLLSPFICPSPCSPAQFSHAPASFFLVSVALSCSPCCRSSPYLSVWLPALILFSSLSVALPARGCFCLSVPLPVLVCPSPSRCLSLSPLPFFLSPCRFFLPLCQTPRPRPSLTVPFPASCFLARRRPPPSSWLPLFSSLLAPCSRLPGFGGGLCTAAQLSRSPTD